MIYFTILIILLYTRESNLVIYLQSCCRFTVNHKMTLKKILIFYLKIEFINLINTTINKFNKYFYSNINYC